MKLTPSDLAAVPHLVKPDRRLFIGGSDARIIMSPDEAAVIRLWKEKRGEVEPMDLSDNLNRDSLNDQRIDGSLPVQGTHGCVDCAVEGVGISEGLMGQMARLEIVPDNLDVVEFGCVFWQPLDGEPVFARLDGFKSELADMDRPVVLDQYDRFYCPSWLRTEQVVELLEVSDEVAAALGLARMHNQLARDMIE